MRKVTYEIFIWVGQKQHSFSQQIFKRCQSVNLGVGVSINRGVFVKMLLTYVSYRKGIGNIISFNRINDYLRDISIWNLYIKII